MDGLDVCQQNAARMLLGYVPGAATDAPGCRAAPRGAPQALEGDYGAKLTARPASSRWRCGCPSGSSKPGTRKTSAGDVVDRVVLLFITPIPCSIPDITDGHRTSTPRWPEGAARRRAANRRNDNTAN